MRSASRSKLLVTSLAGSAIGTHVVGTLDSDKVCNKGDVFIVISPPQQRLDRGGDSRVSR